MTVGAFIGEIASLHDAQTAAALDNKQNMEQREQYYATVRKPLRSPIHEIGTLEKIPGNQRGERHVFGMLCLISKLIIWNVCNESNLCFKGKGTSLILLCSMIRKPRWFTVLA